MNWIKWSTTWSVASSSEQDKELSCPMKFWGFLDHMSKYQLIALSLSSPVNFFTAYFQSYNFQMLIYGAGYQSGTASEPDSGVTCSNSGQEPTIFRIFVVFLSLQENSTTVSSNRPRPFTRLTFLIHIHAITYTPNTCNWCNVK